MFRTELKFASTSSPSTLNPGYGADPLTPDTMRRGTFTTVLLLFAALVATGASSPAHLLRRLQPPQHGKSTDGCGPMEAQAHGRSRVLQGNSSGLPPQYTMDPGSVEFLRDLFITMQVGLDAPIEPCGYIINITLADSNYGSQVSIECEKPPRVTRTVTSLHSRNVRAILPGSISALTSLTRFSTWNSSFQPELLQILSQVPSLRFLSLFDTTVQDSDPWVITKLTNLEYLHFSYVPLGGTIPAELSSLRKLTDLRLVDCSLTGTIPSTVGSLTGLRSLSLTSNQLVGTLPSTLTQLKELGMLAVSSNFLAGPYPVALGRNSSSNQTRDINLQDNYFSADPRVPIDQLALAVGSNPQTNNCFPLHGHESRSPEECQLFCNTTYTSFPCGGSGVCAPSPQYSSVPFQCTLCGPGLVPTSWLSPPNQTCAIFQEGAAAAKLSPGAIAGLAVGAILGSLLLGVTLYFCTRRMTVPHTLLVLPPLSGDLRVFRVTELRAATENFSPRLRLGQGAYGEVFKGTLKREGNRANPREVAVKRQLSGTVGNEGAQSAFTRELELHSRVRHTNHVIHLLGYALERNRGYLVCEMAGNGSIRSILDKQEPSLQIAEFVTSLAKATGLQGGAQSATAAAPPLTWDRRVQLALGTARGLHHLHSGVDGGGILHLDIKPANILVDGKFNAKLADFGVAWAKKEDATLDEGTLQARDLRGTKCYIDPYFFVDNTLTKKSDVFSFGVVMLELATGWVPSAGFVVEGMPVTFWKLVLHLVNTRGFASVAAPAIVRPPPDDSESSIGTSSSTAGDIAGSLPSGSGDLPGVPSAALFRRFVCLAIWCCAYNRVDRPEIGTVVRILEEIQRGSEGMGEEGVVLESDAQQLRPDLLGVALGSRPAPFVPDLGLTATQTEVNMPLIVVKE